MELERAKAIAEGIVKRYSPFCQRIEVAGSIRRRKPQVNDIDLVLISENRDIIERDLMHLFGPLIMSGKKVTRVDTGDNFNLDIYYATPETWATLLLIRTGSKENNIRLCTLAKKRGWHLAANGDGLFNEKGERIAGDSEESIYEALGVPYQEPWQRR